MPEFSTNCGGEVLSATSLRLVENSVHFRTLVWRLFWHKETLVSCAESFAFLHPKNPPFIVAVRFKPCTLVRGRTATTDFYDTADL